MPMIHIPTIAAALPYAGKHVKLFCNGNLRSEGVLKTYPPYGYIHAGGPLGWVRFPTDECYIFESAANPAPEIPPLAPPDPVPASWLLTGDDHTMRQMSHDLVAGDKVTLTLSGGATCERVVSRVDSAGDVYVLPPYWRDQTFVTGILGVVRVERSPASDPDPAERLDTLRATAADLASEIEEVEAEVARAAEDARYPLPEGYAWRPDTTYESVILHGLSEEVALIAGDDLYVGGADFSLAAIRALIVRHDAEKAPEPYSVDIPRDHMMRHLDHDFEEGDLVELVHADGRKTAHTLYFLGDDGDCWVEPAYETTFDVLSVRVGSVGYRDVVKITRL